MRLEAEIIDLTFLDKAFNLPKLMQIHKQLKDIKKEMEDNRIHAIGIGSIRGAVEWEKKLYYITSNIHQVEVVMMSKESDLFEFEQYDLICKN